MTKEQYETRYMKKYKKTLVLQCKIAVQRNLKTLGVFSKTNVKNLEKRLKKAEISCERFERKFNYEKKEFNNWKRKTNRRIYDIGIENLKIKIKKEVG